MTTPAVYTDRRFGSVFDQDSGRTFENIVLERCEFTSCRVSMTHDPSKRSTFRNVRLTNCVFQSGGVAAALLEDIVVDGLKTRNLLQVFGAALKHVTLKGRIGRVMFSPVVSPATAYSLPDVQAAFRRANAAYYRSVDWAIDIREADADELELTGIPGRLVRRNPENSILIKAANLRNRNWRLGIENSIVELGISRMLEYQLEDKVQVVCRRSKDYSREIELFKILRETGIAEPD